MVSESPHHPTSAIISQLDRSQGKPSSAVSTRSESEALNKVELTGTRGRGSCSGRMAVLLVSSDRDSIWPFGGLSPPAMPSGDNSNSAG